MVLVLALDTSTPAASVALANENELLAEVYLDVGLQHGGRLFSEIERLLQAASLRGDQLDAIAVTIGPGSFTGLRTSLSAAKGFCLAIGRPLVAVPTLEALAAYLPYARHPVCALLDARKGEVYVGLYDCSTGLPVAMAPPAALAPAAVLAWRAGQATIYVGDGARAYRSLLASDPAACFAPPHYARPSARVVARLGFERLQRGELADVAGAEPEYLRAPDARVGRNPVDRA